MGNRHSHQHEQLDAEIPVNGMGELRFLWKVNMALVSKLPSEENDISIPTNGAADDVIKRELAKLRAKARHRDRAATTRIAQQYYEVYVACCKMASVEAGVEGLLTGHQLSWMMYDLYGNYPYLTRTDERDPVPHVFKFDIPDDVRGIRRKIAYRTIALCIIRSYEKAATKFLDWPDY